MVYFYLVQIFCRYIFLLRDLFVHLFIFYCFFYISFRTKSFNLLHFAFLYMEGSALYIVIYVVWQQQHIYKITSAIWLNLFLVHACSMNLQGQSIFASKLALYRHLFKYLFKCVNAVQMPKRRRREETGCWASFCCAVDRRIFASFCCSRSRSSYIFLVVLPCCTDEQIFHFPLFLPSPYMEWMIYVVHVNWKYRRRVYLISFLFSFCFCCCSIYICSMYALCSLHLFSLHGRCRFAGET